MSSLVCAGAWVLQEMEDDIDEQLQLAFIMTKLKKKLKRRHRFWVHDIVARRMQLGAYNNLVMELALDREKFRGYFRMSHETFDEVLSYVGPVITKKTVVREPLHARQRLAICLR